MQPIIIYSEKTSPRLLYVLNWLFNDQLETSYTLTHDQGEINNGSFAISYGLHLPGTLSVPDTGLLWETGIKQQEVIAGNWHELPTLFSTTEKNYTLPFDIFSAIFFLLSRYEEYYTYTPDKYGRYPATESVLYKNNCLRRPIIDEWVGCLRQLLKQQFNQLLPEANFSFLPTYDIDIAYSYLHKGLLRNAGGFAKDILTGKVHMADERMKVLRGSKKDPYDSFDLILQLHNGAVRKPIYFILAALQNTPYDKNILPSKQAMISLLRRLSQEGEIGMHPSFYTDTNSNTWNAEKNLLEKITGANITTSRQHYIKMRLPDTYRFLMENGIAEDYSMGYGSHLGFRAGSGQSFQWYDIEREHSTTFVVHPFYFMDTTAHYEENLSADDAFKVLKEMTQKLQGTNSTAITIFHNFSLGSDAEWNGWVEHYTQFIKSLA